jgi:hypothetical protein
MSVYSSLPVSGEGRGPTNVRRARGRLGAGWGRSDPESSIKSSRLTPKAFETRPAVSSSGERRSCSQFRKVPSGTLAALANWDWLMPAACRFQVRNSIIAGAQATPDFLALGRASFISGGHTVLQSLAIFLPDARVQYANAAGIVHLHPRCGLEPKTQ